MSARLLVLSVLLFLYATPCLADWGESWGSMVWGANSPAVPAVGGAGLVVMALLFLALGAAAQRLGAARILPVVMVLLAPVVALGVTNVFQNGTAADADEVNENFAELESALPLLAYSGETNLSRHNSAGTTTASLGSTTNRVCFLTSVAFEDLDAGGENATCHVAVAGSSWELQATLVGTSDADAWCRARCLTW